MTVSHFGNPRIVAALPWYFAMSLVMQSTVSTIVQVSEIRDPSISEDSSFTFNTDVLHLSRMEDIAQDLARRTGASG
jgi:hypothetical protein